MILLRLFVAVSLIIWPLLPAVGAAKANTPEQAKQSTVDELLSQAQQLQQEGEYTAALEPLHAALDLTLAKKDYETAISVLDQLGTIYYDLGLLHAAMQQYQQLLAVLQKAEIDDPVLIAAVHGRIAQTQRWRGEYDLALSTYKKAMAMFTAEGDTFLQIVTLNYMGDVYREQAKVTEALENYLRAERIIDGGDCRTPDGVDACPRLDANNKVDLANTYLEMGDTAHASDAADAAFDLYRSQELPLNAADTLVLLAEISQADHTNDMAALRLTEAAALYRTGNEADNEADMHYRLGMLHAGEGNWAAAIDSFHRAEEIYSSVNSYGTGIAKVKEGEGEALLALKDSDAAEIAFAEAGTILADLARQNIDAGYRDVALSQVSKAVALCARTSNRKCQILAQNNLGVVLYRAGDYQEALAAYEEALKLAGGESDADLPDGSRWMVAYIYQNLGELHNVLGQPETAETLFVRAAKLFRSLQTDASRHEEAVGGEAAALTSLAVVRQKLAIQRQEDTLLAQGRADAQSAVALARQTGDSKLLYTALNNFAGYVNGAGTDIETALEPWLEAADIAQETGDPWSIANALYNTAGVYRDFFEFERAIELYARAQSMFSDIEAPLDEAMTLNEMGFLSQVLDRQADALRYYSHAIELIEASYSELLQPRQAVTFLDDQVGIYLRTVNLLADTGAWADAFQVSEQARARSFLGQLATSSLTSSGGLAAVKEAQRLKNERAGQQRILQQLRALAPEARSEADNATIAAAEVELEANDRAFAALCVRLQHSSPQDAALLCRTRSTLDEIQGSLDEDTSLVAYFFTTDRVLAFVVSRNAFHAVELPVDEDELRTMIVEGFRGDDLRATSAPPSTIGPLYDVLVRPIQPYLQTNRLAIVPHDVLHYLAFAALFDGKQYLSDRYSIFTLPSASALPYAEALHKSGTSPIQALVLGNPTRDLYIVEEQVQNVAARYGTVPLVRSQASETIMRSKASEAGLIHVAAHGLYNAADPLRTALDLAPDARNDGRLEVNEIYTLDLHRATNLVVLSACESNINDLRTQRAMAVSPGDEVISLSRAFLYAGAPAVVASLWAVPAEQTNLLINRFYAHWDSGTAADEALQQAQRDVRASYPHPYFWAGFVVTGSPGRGFDGS